MKKLLLFFMSFTYFITNTLPGGSCGTLRHPPKEMNIHQRFDDDLHMMTQECKDSSLFQAVHRANFDLASRLLKAGAQAHVIQEKKGETALHITARKGQTSLLRLLINATERTNLNSCNDVKSTPLHDACCNGHTQCAAALLEAGANPHTHDKFSQTPLYTAIRFGRNACVDLLLQHNASPNFFIYGNAPLLEAANIERIALFHALVQAGGDMARCDHLPRLSHFIQVTYKCFLQSLALECALKPRRATINPIHYSDNMMQTLCAVTKQLEKTEMDDREEQFIDAAKQGYPRLLASLIVGVSEDCLVNALYAATTAEMPSIACVRILLGAGASPLVEDAEGRDLVSLISNDDIRRMVQAKADKLDPLAGLSGFIPR